MVVIGCCDLGNNSFCDNLGSDGDVLPTAFILILWIGCKLSCFW